MALKPYTPTDTTHALRRVTHFIIPICVLFVCIVGPFYPIFIVGLVPLLGTLLLSGLHALIRRRAPNKGLSRLAVALLDTFVGLCYLGALLPQWVGPQRAIQHVEWSEGGWGWDNADRERRKMSEVITLVTYASCPFLVNMALHFFLALNEYYGMIKHRLGAFLLGSAQQTCERCTECPMCREAEAEERRRRMEGPVSQRNADRGAAFSLLGDTGSQRETAEA